MHTAIVSAHDDQVLRRVQDILDARLSFALPTDTVYGLACRFDDPQGIQSIYEAKGRPGHKALPVLLGTEDHLSQVTPPSRSPLLRALGERFWPGPLTLILEAGPHLPPDLLAGGSTVAVRVVAHPVFQSIAMVTGPLATTSANRSGDSDCGTAPAVLRQLRGRIPLIVDGGATPETRPSTIVEVQSDTATILREGSLSSAVRAFMQDWSASAP